MILVIQTSLQNSGLTDIILLKLKQWLICCSTCSDCMSLMSYEIRDHDLLEQVVIYVRVRTKSYCKTLHDLPSKNQSVRGDSNHFLKESNISFTIFIIGI